MKAIVINSAKGGVGKTRTATELAKELVRRGHTVSIWDLDVTTPNVEKIEGVDVYTSKLRSMPNKTTIKRFIKESYDTTTTDYVIIDTPPTISEMYLAISSYLRNAEFFFVTTRDGNSVKDTGVGMRFFALYGIDVSKVIVNMSNMFKGHTDDEIEDELDVEIVARIGEDGHMEYLCDHVLELEQSEFRLNNIDHDPILSRLSKITEDEVKNDRHLPLRFYNLETWDIIVDRIMERELMGSHLNVSASEIAPYLEYNEEDFVYVRINKPVSVLEKFLPFEVVKCYITLENKVSRGLPMLVTAKGTHLWIGEASILSDREVNMIIEDGGLDMGDSIFLDFYNQMYMFRAFTRFELHEERSIIELYEKKTGIYISEKDKVFTIAMLENDVKSGDYDDFNIDAYISKQEGDFKDHLEKVRLIGVEK